MSVRSRRPHIFVLVFVLAAMVQFAILLAAPVRPFIDGFSRQLASVSAQLIRSAGGVCLDRAAVLSNPAKGFAMEVRDGCNGVNVVILLWSAMLAFPASFKWRFIGLGAGLVAIQLVNLLRLISLFYLGQHSPSLFEFAHLYLWETLIIIDGMVVFALWSRRAAQP